MLYYRWYIVNNQNTCFLDIIGLIDGWHSCAEEAKKSTSFPFKECLFGVRKIEESAIPERLFKSINK